MKISRASSHSGKNTLRTAMTLRGLKCARVCESVFTIFIFTHYYPQWINMIQKTKTIAMLMIAIATVGDDLIPHP